MFLGDEAGLGDACCQVTGRRRLHWRHRHRAREGVGTPCFVFLITLIFIFQLHLPLFQVLQPSYCHPGLLLSISIHHDGSQSVLHHAAAEGLSGQTRVGMRHAQK